MIFTLKLVYSFFQTILGIGEWVIKSIILGGWTVGKRAFSNGRKIRIIANGPSLNEDLKAVPDEDVDYYMLNNSVITPLFFQLKPSRYIIIDPLYFTKILGDVNNGVLSSILSIDWPIELYVPSTSVKYVRRLVSANSNVIVRPTPTSIPSDIKLRGVRNFFFKHMLASPPIQNVVVGAIYTSIMCGYDHIELYGVGHSWTTQLAVNQNNEVCIRDIHYYDSNATMKPWLQCNGEPYKMHIILRDLAQMFESYWDLRYLADSIGKIKIINKTKESFIDAFDRES